MERHGLHLLLRKLILTAGQRMHSGGWRAVGKEERSAPPREDINKLHLKFSEPRHCQDPGEGVTAGSLLPSLSRDVGHQLLW